MGGLIASSGSRPEVWAGPECSYLTVGDWTCDQLALSGHDERADDIDRLADLGVRAVRYPVLWGRDRGTSEATDWTWAAERVGRLRERGIQPIVGLLHHGFGPTGTDPLDPQWPAALGRFAAEAARRLTQADAWLPINEPLTTARFGALYGWWPPYATDDDTFVSLLLAMAEGWVAAARAIREVNPHAVLIANEDIGKTEGTDPVRPAIEHANERRWLTFDLVTGRVGPAHPLWGYLAGSAAHRAALKRLRSNPTRPDLLGVDHYVTSDRYLDHRLERYPGVLGGASVPYADVELARVVGHELGGFGRVIQETWRRYSMPIALTEVQLGGEPDDQCAWWSEAWQSSLAAHRRGIPIVGVTAWSVFGAFEWCSVLRSPRGAYEAGCYAVTPDGLKPTPLAVLVQRTASGDDPDVTPGWWRNPTRVTFEANGPALNRGCSLP